MQSYRERERANSSIRWLVLSQGRARSQELLLFCLDAGAQALDHLLRCVSREMDLEWSSLDASLCLLGGSHPCVGSGGPHWPEETGTLTGNPLRAMESSRRKLAADP